MKNVFVVSGSEDGNLGVFTNKKLTFERMMKYIGEGAKMNLYDCNHHCIGEVDATYRHFCTQSRLSGYITIHEPGHSVQATAESFTVNQH